MRIRQRILILGLASLACLFSSSLRAEEDDRLPLHAVTEGSVSCEQESTFDDYGRRSEVTDFTGTYTFDYDDKDRLTRIFYPNGVETQFVYDDEGRVARIRHSTALGGVFLKYRYEYDREDRRSLMERISQGEIDTTTYEYTPKGYLERANYSSPRGQAFEAFTYDERGNRLSKKTESTFIEYEYESDLLVRAGDTWYVYDNAGCLAERHSSSRSETFTFGKHGLLEQVDDGEETLRFSYNAVGERIGKATDEVEILYGPLESVYCNFRDRVKIADIFNGADHHFCYGEGLLGSAHPDGFRYYLYSYPDGSVDAYLDDAVLTLLEFDAFGVPQSAAHTCIGMNGEWYDVETGFYYLYNRYYDPEIGRFISPDPFVGHPYTYCDNDPINYVDPLGLFKWGRPGKAGDSIKGWPKPQPAPKPAPKPKPIKQTPPPKPAPKPNPPPSRPAPPPPSPSPFGPPLFGSTPPPPPPLPSTPAPSLPPARPSAPPPAPPPPSSMGTFPSMPSMQPPPPPTRDLLLPPPSRPCPPPRPAVPSSTPTQVPELQPPSFQPPPPIQTPWETKPAIPNSFNIPAPRDGGSIGSTTSPPSSLQTNSLFPSRSSAEQGSHEIEANKLDRMTAGEGARELGSALSHEVLDVVGELVSPLSSLIEEVSQIGRPGQASGNRLPERLTYQELLGKGHQAIDHLLGTDQGARYAPEVKAAKRENMVWGIMPPPMGSKPPALPAIRAGQKVAAVAEELLPISQEVTQAKNAGKIPRSISTAVKQTPTPPNSTKGWQLGDDIKNLTREGSVPSWDGVRARLWKNEVISNSENYAPENLERMRKGLAPRRWNASKQKWDSMEWHHDLPQREGGLFDVKPYWPEEHAKIDPYRHVGN